MGRPQRFPVTQIQPDSTTAAAPQPAPRLRSCVGACGGGLVRIGACRWLARGCRRGCCWLPRTAAECAHAAAGMRLLQMVGQLLLLKCCSWRPLLQAARRNANEASSGGGAEQQRAPSMMLRRQRPLEARQRLHAAGAVLRVALRSQAAPGTGKGIEGGRAGCKDRQKCCKRDHAHFPAR